MIKVNLICIIFWEVKFYIKVYLGLGYIYSMINVINFWIFFDFKVYKFFKLIYFIYFKVFFVEFFLLD